MRHQWVCCSTRSTHSVPGAVPLVHEGEQLSYAELNGRANQLAHYLRRNCPCTGRGVVRTIILYR